MESFIKKIFHSKDRLKDLDKLFKEGKDRNEAEVKVIEDEIRTALDIPKESWMNTGQTLKDVIEILHKQLDIVQNATIPSEVIPDKDVLKNASGGLALEGVFRTRNPEDLLVKRERLIESSDSFSLTNPIQNTTCEQREFSSHKSEKAFYKTMQRMGHSFSSSFQIGFKNFGFGFGLETNTCDVVDETSSNSREESYILQTRYNYIPLACGVLEKDELRLSTSAQKALTEIEMSLYANCKPQTDLVRCFFERFGSHVNQGPVHFGGIFQWRASASGFRSSDLSEIKRLTSESLNVYCGGGLGFGSLSVSGKAATSSLQLKGSLIGKHREDLMTQVYLSVSKTGGPAENDDYLVWKSHLAANNKTWSVIDRGTTLIPVWEIITTSHRHEFKDVSNLSRILMDAYREITGHHVEEMGGENIISQMEKAETLMQSVKTWSATDCESNLRQLLVFKTKLFDEIGSHGIWFNTCLSNEILQNYLFKVTTVNSESTAMNLKLLMRCLLGPDLYTVESFPKRSQIVNWAYQTQEGSNEQLSVSDFSELSIILRCANKELEDSRNAFSSPDQEENARKKATNTVTYSLNSFCKTLGESDRMEEKLLIISIITAIGYSSEYKTFSHLMTINEITFVQTELHNALSRYSSLRKQCPIRAQAYLLLTALTISADRSVSPREKEERLHLVHTELKDELLSPIRTVLKKMQNDWESLEKALHSMTQGDSGSMLKEEEVEWQLKDAGVRVEKVRPLHELPKMDDHNESVHYTSEKGRKFMNLLQTLGLKYSYPKKLSKASVLAIDKLSLSINEPETEEDLSSHYLYKLMILDYRARYLFVKPEISRNFEKDTVNDEDLDNVADDGEDFFDCDDQSDIVNSSKQEHIHPMDLHMAIFHCSSNFLRQYIYTKLSSCQFSLPFLVPSPCSDEVEFPLWALRHIRKSWHSKIQTASDTCVQYHNSQMFNAQVPIVSFFRLGISDSNSKSQILNDVINKQKHPVFFNRHCKGSTPHSLLMNGLVEIAWYCPRGNEDDIFGDCVAFLNLHGDAVEHPKQLEFLQAVSTVNVLLLSEHPMSEPAKKISQTLSKSSVPLICLFSGKDKIQPSKNPMKVRLAAKNRNQAEFSEELVSSIKLCICDYKHTASIERCCDEARKQHFIVDEDEPSSQEGKAKAQTLMAVLSDVYMRDKSASSSTLNATKSLKETLLPLQGKLWQDWCIKNKEKYRLRIKETESIQMRESEILSNMKNIRKLQREKVRPLNDFMRSFLECLITHSQFEDTHLYLLQWLKILLDDLTSNELALLEEDYHSTWRKMKNVPKGKDKASDISPLQSKLDNITNKMTATTVGIQHIMREVSQLYEATKEKADEMSRGAEGDCEYETLPKMAVKMLISGYPLELMDGDAAHVPLVWINAVLDELISTLQDKKVFVLSILGLQSSGKSTLLNTMFGLQFAVSAGRCTRGAFMQLVEVKDSSTRNELGYDFILIVDTEGLRSPELSTKTSLNHDNELATFIIGIGDMTVINIMGENPSEMHDILQICVQAFLRMKRVKFSPSCIFVHQNVAELSAGDKNREGKRRLLEKLDEMAKMAAKEENVDGITCFSDVIHFDTESQVFYFKNLLEGDPPMAPINASYSQNVQELKNKLLTIKTWKEKVSFENCKFSTLSEFKCRVSDLWKALLRENFVFSFKNTVEMMVYSSLEHKYGDWSWELRKHSLNHQTELENQIGSNLIQDVTLVNVGEKLNKVYNQIKTEMEKYFMEDKNKDTLIKWKANVDTRFTTLNDELIAGTFKKCNELLEIKKTRSELDQNKAKFTDQLTAQSKTLAFKLKKLKTQHLTDDKMKEEFDKLWVNWTTDVMKCQPTKEPLNVNAIVENALLEKFQHQSNINAKVREGKEFKLDPKTHLQRSFWDRLLGKGSSNCSIQSLWKNIVHSVDEYLSANENGKRDFNINFIYQILSDITKNIEKFESIPDNPKFTKEFRVDVSVSICLTNVLRLQKMHDDFKRSNHPLTYLQSQRETYFQSFKHYCKGANSVTIFVDFLCENITPAILNAANTNTYQEIADRLKRNNPALNGNRSNLEKHILRDLANQENFNMYEEYIDHPKVYFQKFIQKKVHEFCRDDNMLSTLHQEHLESLKNQLLIANTDVAKEVSDKKGNAFMWLDLFCKNVGQLIVIKKDDFRSIENEDISDWEFLKDTMARSLVEMIKNVKMDREILREKPTTILFQQLQGCWAQCPFCKAICTNTIPNHDECHSVQFHRSEALSGRHWEGTEAFAIEFCTTAIISDCSFRHGGKWIPYKNYTSAGDPYDKWSITEDGSTQSYWKWFLCKFRSKWEGRYGYKFTGKGEIPYGWKEIKKDDVLKEL